MNITKKSRVKHGMALRRLRTLILLCSVFLSFRAMSQQPDVHSYQYPFSIKNFTIKRVPVPGQQDFVTVGTVFKSPFGPNPGTENHVIFQHLDEYGYWNTMTPGVGPSVHFGANTDDRAVDIVPDLASNPDFYITSMSRLGNNGFARLEKVDVDGATIDINPSASFNGWLYNATAGSGTPNMFPTHSLFHSNGDLYICGYLCANYTGEPDFTTNKVGFVIRINITTPTYAITEAVTINTTGGNNLDFDIPMRITELANGNIFVTGSCNMVFTQNQSSALALELNTGSSLAVQNDWSQNLDNGGQPDDEYSIGIIEDANTGYIFMAGNSFIYSSTSPGYFDPQPQEMWVSYIDPNNAAVPTTTARFHVNSSFFSTGTPEVWALQVMPPATTSTTMTIAGMQMGDGCTIAFPSSTGSVHPFLTDMTIGVVSGAITPTINTWVTHMTQPGTGTGALGYLNLGNGLSNVAWNSAFVAPLPNQITIPPPDYNHYMMMAPTWYTAAPNLLAAKFIRPDDNLVTPNCVAGSTTTCGNPGFTVYDVQGVTAVTVNTGQQSNMQRTNYEIKVGDAQPANEPLCDDMAGDTDFRMSINTTKENSTTTLFPNPANTYVQLSLKGNIAADANVKAELYNIYGQRVAELYNGFAENINGTQMRLPDVASGMYVVRVYTNSKLQSQHKLSIE